MGEFSQSLPRRPFRDNPGGNEGYHAGSFPGDAQLEWAASAPRGDCYAGGSRAAFGSLTPKGWALTERRNWGECWVREQKESPDRSRGCLTYAATCSAVRGGPSYWCGLVSASGVEGRAGLVTPAMKRSANLIALSMERQG